MSHIRKRNFTPSPVDKVTPYSTAMLSLTRQRILLEQNCFAPDCSFQILNKCFCALTKKIPPDGEKVGGDTSDHHLDPTFKVVMKDGRTEMDGQTSATQLCHTHVCISSISLARDRRRNNMGLETHIYRPHLRSYLSLYYLVKPVTVAGA